MPRKLDYIDLIRKQGARVLPPKKPVAEIASEISIDDTVARLRKQWRNPDSQQPTEIPTARPEYSVERPEHELDEIVDCVVVSFNTADSRPGIGLARILRGGPRKKKGEKRTDGLLIREKNIVTEGEIRVGVKIRGKLAPPESDAHIFSLVQIEIYK
jgi:hypothetical protein